jgi:predicted DCC family thiol-disulfide oxidoreductase YuxK
VVAEAAELHVRSDAVTHVLETLGGLWRFLAITLWVVPRPLRDLGYDAIASARKRIFGRTSNACPMMPRALGARFDP